MPLYIMLNEFEESFINISGTEEWREYDFGNGNVVRVNNPIALLVKQKPNGDSHKLIDAEGVRHYIPAGWISFRFSGHWVF